MGHDAQFESTAFPPVPFPTLDHRAEQLCHVYLLPNKYPVQVSALRTHTCPTCIKGARSLQSRNLQFGFSSGGSHLGSTLGPGQGPSLQSAFPGTLLALAQASLPMPCFSMEALGTAQSSQTHTRTNSHAYTHTHSLACF